MTFWKWLFRGCHFTPSSTAQKVHPSQPGYTNILNYKLGYHALVATLIARAISSIEIHKIASAVTVPLIAIFIGVLYTFGATFQNLLQDNSVSRIMRMHTNRIYEYSYNYQLSLLIFFSTLAYWSALCIDTPMSKLTAFYALEFGTFLLSLTIYSVWSFISIVQELLIKKHELIEKELNRKQQN